MALFPARPTTVGSDDSLLLHSLLQVLHSLLPCVTSPAALTGFTMAQLAVFRFANCVSLAGLDSQTPSRPTKTPTLFLHCFCTVFALLCVRPSVCRYETIKAADAVAALKASLKPVATAKRDGQWKNLDAKELVPGDMVLLGAGSAIPAGV